MKRPSRPNTAAILRVHPSNYKISGFTAEVPLEELVRIGHGRGIIVIDDVGAGPLLDFSRFGFDKEPTLQESVQAGADLITASADKLIGASQGGIILGRADLIRAVRKNPLARIVRVGKLTLAALEATLSLFLDEAQALRGAHAADALPRVWPKSPPRPSASPQAIGQRTGGGGDHGRGVFADGQRFAARRRISPPGWWRWSGHPCESGELASRLRRHRPPVFARVHKARCWPIRARCWTARNKCWWRRSSKRCRRPYAHDCDRIPLELRTCGRRHSAIPSTYLPL